MARREHETQDVVAHLVVNTSVDCLGEIRCRHGVLRVEFSTDFRFLAGVQTALAQKINGAVLGCGCEPRGGIVGNAFARPLFERGDQGVLRQFFRQADVAHRARECTDDLGGFDPPDRVEGAMRLVGRDRGHLFLRALLAQEFFMPAHLRCEFGAEVLGLVDLAQFQLDIAVAIDGRPALDPFERFFP